MVEPETALYESHDIGQRSLASTPLTWRAIDALRNALATQGVDVDACRLVEQWLSPESELWTHCDPDTFLQFEDIDAGIQAVHAGGWDLDIRRQEIRLVLAQLGTICWRNLTAAIAMSGLCEDAQELVDGAVKELKNPCTSYAIKFHHVFARKSRPARKQVCDRY